MNINTKHFVPLGLIALGISACAETTDAPADYVEPVEVVFAQENPSLANHPFPSDHFTVADPSSATQRRLALPVTGESEAERSFYERLNSLDGFGTFTPISIPFSAAIDYDEVTARHHDNDDFRDDAIYLINVDSQCERYGEEVALDFGGGHYPASRLAAESSEQPGANVAFDALADANNLLFAEHCEDTNGNGRLDAGEDLDRDGVLDTPNFADATCLPGGQSAAADDTDAVDRLLTHWERETNTLIGRPLWPLEPGCTHAVILTDRIHSAEGGAIIPPTDWDGHSGRDAALAPLERLVRRYEMDIDDVVFAWSFTTGTVTDDIQAIRAGLYGHGTFAELADAFPTAGLPVWTQNELTGNGSGEPALVEGGCAALGLNEIAANEGADLASCGFETELASVATVFGGTFEAPNLLFNRDGQADGYPGDANEIWVIDPQNERIEYDTTEVTYWCALPFELETCEAGNPNGTRFCAPFPTAIYAHDLGGSRADVLDVMARHTEAGVAVCALDAFGHGANSAWVEYEGVSDIMRFESVLESLGAEALAPMMLRGRDRDLDGDGAPESGADAWTGDFFHTRDVIRQTAIEHIQFVRILRSFDGVRQSEDGRLFGDVNNDGAIDIGGAQGVLSMWGEGYGAIITGVVGGAEPNLDAISPHGGAAGLTDLIVRSADAEWSRPVLSHIAGQQLIACLPTGHDGLAMEDGRGSDCLGGHDGAYWNADVLRMALVTDEADAGYVEFAAIEGIHAGDRVRFENLTNGVLTEGYINNSGELLLSVPADAMPAAERRAMLRDRATDEGVTATNTRMLGDALRVTVFAGESDRINGRVDTFQSPASDDAIHYPAGSALVAIEGGMGIARNTPEFRRLMDLTYTALAPADPVAWAPHYNLDPIDSSYAPTRTRGVHVLAMNAAADSEMVTSTGVTLARAAGVFGSYLRDEDNYGAANGWRELNRVDSRYGQSIQRELIDRYVVEGDARLKRYEELSTDPTAVYDIDDFAELAETDPCSDSDAAAGLCDKSNDTAPVTVADPGQRLRMDRQRLDGSFDAFRVPMMLDGHTDDFDYETYTTRFTVRFLASEGYRVEQNAACDCAATDVPMFETKYDGDLTLTCNASAAPVCNSACADVWQIRTMPAGFCSAN